MAGSDSQKQLLTLIRDFTTEKSQGERRIVNQKKRIGELRSELDAANGELEEAKRGKETTEQELRGYEVELSMNEASLQALEARIALINSDISTLEAELAALKNEENSLRDGFFGKMLDLNGEIRKFQEYIVSSSNADKHAHSTFTGGSLTTNEQDGEQVKLVSENTLAHKILLTDKEEQQYQAEKKICDQVKEELSNLERKALLLESVVKESMELQELSRQTSVLEAQCAAFGDELQKRFLCPRCNQDNSADLGEIVQPSYGS